MFEKIGGVIAEGVAMKHVAEQAGLDINPDSIVYSEKQMGEIHETDLIAEDKDGRNNFRIFTQHRDAPPITYNYSSDEMFSFGVLRNTVYVYETPHSGDIRYTVDSLSSPAAYNDLQVELGRTPGVDCFEMVRPDGGGVYAPGEYTEYFGQMQVPVADIDPNVHWYDVKHDIQPIDHVQAWISLAPEQAQQISAYADTLVRKYGDLIHADEGERPQEIDNFTDAIDALSRHTRSLAYIAEDSRLNPDDADAISKVDVEDRIHQRLLADGWRRRGFIRVATSIGLIEKDLDHDEARLRAQKVAYQLVANICDNRLKADRLHPEAMVSAEVRETRHQVWEALKAHFSEPAHQD